MAAVVAAVRASGLHVDFHNKLITGLSTQYVDTKERGKWGRVGGGGGVCASGRENFRNRVDPYFPETRALKS